MSLTRLIFVNRFFYPDESATSQILTDLGFHLAERGWPVMVIASRVQGGNGAGLPRTETVRGVAVRRIGTTRLGKYGLAGRAIDYASFYLGVFFMLLHQARREDVVIAKTDPPMLGVVAGLAVRIRGARLINWLQDLYPEVASALGVAGLTGIVGKSLQRRRDKALCRAAANVVIGRRMGERLRESGVPARLIRHIPNWTDEASIQPMAPSQSLARREWGIEPDRCVIGYSGNLGRAHETETLLAAAHRLRDREDIMFLFVGGGHASELLRKRVEGDGLANFLFKPHQPRERLSHSLAAADVHWLSLRPELEGLIVPSKFYGIAAAARPVLAVVAPDGEIGRLVSETGCGLVVRPGDGPALQQAIIRLAGEPELRQAMGRSARSALETNWSRQAAFGRWEKLLAEICPRESEAPGTAPADQEGTE